ncbi:hypothetical protein [Pelagibaculum spongiae]|uniref:DUF945 domain-containing protein n=1 Tax=Pelagibaculum spongiae TaxID=2080658 RepID=A0A2V1H2N1_9GAMM|nr:hypothetical protein [Pelagibaculum spongiae]PVZ70269.1 hypothetical protein DC094_06635 [Pelagibaculum spongiae]
MSKWLIRSALLLVLIVAGMHSWLWFQIKDQIDVKISRYADTATISYNSFRLYPNASVVLTDLVVTPVATPTNIRADELHLTPESYFQLIRSALGNPGGEIHLKLSNWRLPLDGFVFEDLDNKHRINYLGTPLDALGCGKTYALQSEQLKQMGFQRLSGDLEFSMNMASSSKPWQFNAKLTADQAMSIDLSVGLDNISLEQLAKKSLDQVRLRSLSLHYQDLGYNQLKNEFCAEQFRSNQTDFLKRHTFRVEDTLRRHGLTVSEQALELWHEFQKGSDLFSINTLMQPVKLTELSQQLPMQIVSQLDLSLSLAGKPPVELKLQQIDPDERFTWQDLINWLTEPANKN